jgi:hypothetical protein
LSQPLHNNDTGATYWRSSKVLTWDVKAGRFTNGEVANRFVDMPYPVAQPLRLPCRHSCRHVFPYRKPPVSTSRAAAERAHDIKVKSAASLA